jgi:hypothetical protein
MVRLGVPAVTLDMQGRARPSLATLYNWRYRRLGNLPAVSTAPAFVHATAGMAYEFQFVDVPDYGGGWGAVEGPGGSVLRAAPPVARRSPHAHTLPPLLLVSQAAANRRLSRTSTRTSARLSTLSPSSSTYASSATPVRRRGRAGWPPAALLRPRVCA